ncbi:sodium-dependent proline transporter-like isoform X2 [Grus americana]|uniref:sodium-dependent proline transporter-like isoform X2 n=1 Tax=Grus americana TaxID=9117 RepID=UPI002407BE82|nr:sodium-dependent proline transporter-like isoform X2 [Grus americana]
MEGPTATPTSQPCPGAQPQPEVLEPSPCRETWAGKCKFLVSCLGYCVGLSNFWRFPYLCYRNGGGVFLISYFIMLLVTGLPLFLMGLSLGQYGAAGPITVWKCCPLLKGVPPLQCHRRLGYLLPGLLLPEPPALVLRCPQERRPLPEHVGEHQLGQRQRGFLEGVYFTATFPYLIILILIIRGATLDGSLDGIRFYLSSDWSRLQSAQVWSDVASQVIYSLGIGFGGLFSMASKKFENNVIWDTLIIGIVNCCTSFFAGFAIFLLLGHMAWRKQVPVDSVADIGPGLVFVAFPEAFSLLPGSLFWSILFFLMFFMRGVDSLFRTIHAIAILGEFPALRDRRRKTALLGALCTSFFLLGLLMVTQGGIFWFMLIDKYSIGFGLIIVALSMCLGIVFCYGVKQFCQDIMDMIRQCPAWYSHMLNYFKVCWIFFTPCLLLITLICAFLDTYSVPLYYDIDEFPTWGMNLGICMGVLTCLPIPLWAVVALYRESGSLSERFQKATQPLDSWRTAAARDVARDVMYMSAIITAPPHGSSED